MPGYISQETIDAVLRSSDIVSVVGEYTRLEQRGDAFWGCCPFHNEKTASFHVESEKQFYYCFGCHAGGNVVKFIMEMEKISYVDAITFLAKKAGIEIIYEDGVPEDVKKDSSRDLIIDLYNRTAGMYHYLLTETDGGKDALEYITSRGITLETIKKFKLGYSPSDRRWLKNFLVKKNYSQEFLSKSGLFSSKYPDISFFSDRLMFPIFERRGDVVAFGGRILHGEGPKYLNSGEMIQYKKRETLYAFNFAKKSIREKQQVIFCEGYMDVIAYHQSGIDYAVAPLGTSLTEEQIHIIGGFAKTVLLSFDSDGAGQAATMKAILMCRKNELEVKIIKLKGGKDPAEILLKFGVQTLINDVNSAILDSDFLLSKLAQQYPSGSPEDKVKAALAFFPYVDALRTDIQKETCLEQLARTFNLKLEAVKSDFNHREEARARVENKIRQPEKKGIRDIKLNAELRAVLAVTTHLNYLKNMHDELTSDDFEDPVAKEIFTVLEECYSQNDVSFNSILNRCKRDEIQRMILRVNESNEFSENTLQAVQDSISKIKRNRLERQRENLMNKIRQFNPITSDDQKQLQAFITEKMNLDKKLQ